MSVSIKQFESALVTRLKRGEHLVLYGPRGSGKSVLLAGLRERFAHTRIPCGLSAVTAHLDDVTRALARAYPDVDTAVATRRIARARLRMAADRNGGVLLLDHVTHVNTAMIGFLRRLRGGIVGVLLAVDVENKRDRERLRHRHLGTSTLPMPPASPRRLRKLFRDCCAQDGATRLHPNESRNIIRAARGRPGWIVQCARLMRQARYWRNETLLVSVLCLDTEIMLRQEPPGPLAPENILVEPYDDRRDVVGTG
jgi:predicted ATPase